MALGSFGGKTPTIKRVSGGTGGASVADASKEAKDRLSTSPEGSPIGSKGMNLEQDAAFGDNLVRNGSFESWMCNRDYNGTIVSVGTAVTGTSTAFDTNDADSGAAIQKKRINVSDLLVSSNASADTQMRRVASITSDTALVLASGFGVDITGDRLYSVCPGPDGWTRTGTNSFWDRTQASGEVDHGNAALILTNGNNEVADAGQSITISATQNSGLRGRKVTICVRVKVGTADRVFVKLDDGVDTSSSPNHTGGNTFETLFITHTINDSATKLEWSLEISSGAVISPIFDSVVVVEGETCIAFSEARNDVFGQPSTIFQTISQTFNSAVAAEIPRATFHNVMVGDNESVLFLFNARSQVDTADDQGDWVLRRNDNSITSSFQNTMASTGQNYTVSYSKVDQKPGKGIYKYSVTVANEGGAAVLTVGNTEIQLIRLPAS